MVPLRGGLCLDHRLGPVAVVAAAWKVVAAGKLSEHCGTWGCKLGLLVVAFAPVRKIAADERLVPVAEGGRQVFAVWKWSYQMRSASQDKTLGSHLTEAAWACLRGRSIYLANALGVPVAAVGSKVAVWCLNYQLAEVSPYNILCSHLTDVLACCLFVWACLPGRGADFVHFGVPSRLLNPIRKAAMQESAELWKCLTGTAPDRDQAKASLLEVPLFVAAVDHLQHRPCLQYRDAQQLQSRGTYLVVL